MMDGGPQNTSVFRKLTWILAVSVIILLFYYVQYRPVSVRVQPQIEYPATLPTIVGFQKRESVNVTKQCKPSLPSAIPEDGWQKLDPDWHLYSAYLDNRTGTPLIRIVALLKGYQTGKLFCLTWPDSVLSPIQATELWVRAWDAKPPSQYHHPYLLSCQASATSQSVSVVQDTCKKPSNLLNITRERRDDDVKKFAVCLKPVDFSQDITVKLLEWLELQFLLGADNILVYVHHLHPDTRRVLEHYVGRVTIVDLSPPITNPETNWKSLWQRRRLEIALYNDCFYRHVQSHDFVVNLDLDEAIVPLAHDTWAELLDGPAHQNSASVSARNVYFFDSLGVDPSVPPHLHMLRHVYRSANFTPPGFAQKSFFNTQYAEAVAHHYALRALLRPGGTRLMSSLDLGRARLHHYRSECPKLMEKQCETDFMRYKVRDTAIWRFKEALVTAVARRLQELQLDVQQVTQISTGTDRIDTGDIA